MPLKGNNVRFHNNFLRRYLDIAPSALAYERAIECALHVGNDWKGPILDIGCGDGIFAQILFEGKIDTGIDPDADEVSRARPRNKYNELIVCYGDNIPKPDASYNTVFSNSVLEHILDLQPVLQEVHRLMTDDARFYVTIPTDRLEEATFVARVISAVGLKQLAYRYGKFYNRFWRHYNVHSLEGWRAVFEQAGFDVEIERPYVPKNLSTLYDLMTPLALPALIAKKKLRRWLLVPSLRPFVAPIMNAILAGFVSKAVDARPDDGCLVYYALRKRRQ